MDKFSRGLLLLVAGQVQALGLLYIAWKGGVWLNSNYPQSFNWQTVTFLVGIAAVFHTFYVIIKATNAMAKKSENLEKRGD